MKMTDEMFVKIKRDLGKKWYTVGFEFYTESAQLLTNRRSLSRLNDLLPGSICLYQGGFASALTTCFAWCCDVG